MDQFGGMSDGNLHISDVIEVIQNDENGGAQAQGSDDMQVEIVEEMPRNSFSPMVVMQSTQNVNPRPYIEILEQPLSGIRFRYEIEGRSAGSIPGEHNRPDLKTYPTIRVVGYTGRMVVVVSCVTVEDNPKNPPRPHPHKLVGKAEHCKNGVCRVRLRGDNMTVSFPNLGIQCVKRRDVEASLNERQREDVDPFRTGFDHKKSHTTLALNAVRLCFQGFIPRKENGKVVWDVLDPVVSTPIIEKKAQSTLLIHKLSHFCAPVAGGMEMILLCDKVMKDDIQVRFFEERDGLLVWEGYGDFQPTQVHYQHAIAFRTPKYDNTDIKQPVQVNIQLKLKSKEQYGPALDFEMIPLANVEGIFKPKRKTPRELVSEYSAQNPEKRLKMIDQSLEEFIKCEPRHSPFSMTGGSVSPNPYLPGPSTSPQPGSSYQKYGPQTSSGRTSPMPPIYNIPLNQYQPNIQNHYQFPQTIQTNPQPIQTNPQPPATLAMENSLQNIYLDTPPLQPYQIVTDITLESVGLTLQNEESNISMLDLDNQPEMHFGTSELLDAVLDDDKLSQELNQGLQISDPASEQPSGMTDSLTRLTRDIQSLNEMYKPNHHQN